jgi:hypothetical protein
LETIASPKFFVKKFSGHEFIGVYPRKKGSVFGIHNYVGHIFLTNDSSPKGWSKDTSGELLGA